MFTKLRSSKGFTLIELLIVVAIIGILAAIAIPQFSKYRMQGFNASANSDMRNVKTSEESLYAEHQRYGSTETPATLAAATGTTLAGVEALGGTAGVIPVVSLVDAVGTPRAVQIPVGNNISVWVTTVAGYTCYNGVSKHLQGDTLYGIDSDSTVNYKFPQWPTATTYAGAHTTATAVPAPVAGAVDFPLAAAGAAGWAQM